MLRRGFVCHRALSTLVLANHSGGVLSSDFFSAISASKAIGSDPITVLVAGHGPETASTAESVSKVAGVANVLVADSPSLAHNAPEAMANLLSTVITARSFTTVVAVSNEPSKNTIPRAAALVDAPVVSDVIKVLGPTKFQRPTYAGNAIATVSVPSGPCIVTVRSTSFPVEGDQSQDAAPIESIETPEYSSPVSTHVRDELAKSDRPELSSSKVVISGGRGMKSGENFQLLYTLADLMKGAVGASRAAVDAGYASNDLQVGQTGKVVAPDLYIAVGISGAIQHLAGMKDSKVIVAINKDADAPIFQVADYGIVGDLFEVVPALTEELKK